MKRRKQIFAFAMAGLFLATNVLLFNNKEASAAADNIYVFVNMEMVDFGDTTPQIINDRTMVPVKALADAIGANTEWNDTEKKVTLTLGDMYAVLVIGNDKMTYGKIATDSTGKKSASTTEVFNLDSPPTIVNNRALFPASAIATAFNAEANWVDITKTVYITTSAPVATATPAPVAPVATPTPGPANPVFSDSAYFQEASGKRIEDMHIGKNKFAVVIYDGTQSSSVEAVRTIKEAATNAQYKIYGVDMTSKRFSSPENLTWPWSIATKGNYPVLILSYEGQEDEVVQDITNVHELQLKFENLKQNFPTLPTASPTPTPTPSESASPSATPSPTSGYSWNNISLSDSDAKFDRGEMFIFVAYDSHEDKYNEKLEIVKSAAGEAGVPLYATDLKGDFGVQWWGWQYGSNFISNPTVYIIRGSNYVEVKSYITSSDKSDLKLSFDEFKKNYSNYNNYGY